MDKAAREALARRVLALASGTGESEAIVFASDDGLTRFTHNAIHQNVAHAETTLRVRTVVDRRSGVASSNALDDASLDALVRRAAEMAHLAPRDDDFPGLPRGGTAEAPKDAFVAATAAATPELRASFAAEIFGVAERDGLWAAGYVKTARQGITIANTRGTLASFDGTDCGLNVKQNAADSTGYAESNGTDVAKLGPAGAASRAAAKALRSRAPESVEPGDWTVILEPPAFGDLISYLTDHFSAQAFDEGSSFLCEGLDRKYVGENVSIYDDYAHPLAPSVPFDYEGVPKQRVALIERGVAKNLVTDSYWAAKVGRPNTGHALPAPNADGPLPSNVVVAAGTKPLAQLIAETKRGILVSRFWYIRTVDMRKTIVTGMTRDGTFLIENGEVVRGVRNMRFNQSILAALANVEFSSEPARSVSYSYSNVIPAAKIEGFRFTSSTAF
jgi:predicted Zn-dependent protease